MVACTIEILAWSFLTTKEKRARWDFWTWQTSPNNLPELISPSQSSSSTHAERTWMFQVTSICSIMLSKIIVSTSMHLKKHSRQTIRATLLSFIRARSGRSRSKHSTKRKSMRSRTRDTQQEPSTCSTLSLKIAVHSQTSSRRSWKPMKTWCSQSTTRSSPMFISLWISFQIKQLKRNCSSPKMIKVSRCRMKRY